MEKIKTCVQEIKEKLAYLESMLGEDKKPKSLDELKEMAYKNDDDKEEKKEKSDAV